MMKFLTKIIVRILIILQCTLFSSSLFSQTDYEFWFVAPAVTSKFIPPSPIIYDHLNVPILLYFTIPTGTATVKIEQPANPAFVPIYKVVTSSTAAEVFLTGVLSQIENTPANTILDRGLRISSDQPFTAYYEVQSPYNSAIYTLLGRNALGTEFIVPSQDHHSNYEYTDPPARNVFDIVATEDTTTVIIVPKASIIGHQANDTFQIILNRGQTWSGRAASGDSTAHLGGSFVFSDKPIAITFTDDAVFFANSSPDAIDITGDQLLPRPILTTGKEFVVHNEASSTSITYCYAFEDSTVVNFNDSLQSTTKLINRGEAAQFMFDTTYWTYNASIHSNKPILVYYFGGIGSIFPGKFSSPQAFSAIVPPISCGGSKRVCFAREPPDGQEKWFRIRIITKNGNQDGFSCIPWWFSIPPNCFIVVPGTFGEYVACSQLYTNFPMYTTIIIMNSKGSFQVAGLSWDNVTSTVQFARYSFFSDFNTLYLGTDKHICPGDSTILDAGYGRDSYLWNTGDTTQTIWAKNPGTYWVNITQDSCFLSDTIVISYYWTNPINLGQDRVLCAGDTILLDAGPGRAWYDWSTGDTTQIIYVNQPGTYWVKAPDVHCNVYDTIQITWMDSIDIGPNRNICPGDSVLLDAGIGMTSYLWNTGATTQTVWAKNNGKYKVTVTQGACIFSDSLMVSFNPVPTVNLGPDISICLGQTHTFDAGFCTGCTYSWDDLSLGQINIGTNQTYTTGQAGIYRVTVTGINGCHNRDTVQLFTNADLPVTITITSSLNNVCQGTSVTFSAHTTNGGALPAFQWKVNGVNAGPDDSIYTYVPSNGDIVSCILNSSDTICVLNNPATSDSITMVVNPNQAVSVSVVASQNPVCAGTPVTFTATPTNGGTTPNYQWQVNGANVGANNPVYTYVPANGDLVSCILTSSESCTSNNPASSIEIQMVVNSNLQVGISISASANPVCIGIPVTFTATPTNGGSSPQYQWKVNGLDAGTNSSTFTYTPNNNDFVTCTLTSSLPCTSNNPASSNPVSMSIANAPVVTFTRCFDSITTINAKPIKLKGGIPLGGTYSGPGVNNGYFYPNLAGAGTHAITYTYTNAALCSAQSTVTIVTRNASPFTCGNNLTDIRDDKVYPTVQIGSQCWMASNLNYGNRVPSAGHQRDNCVPEKYCYNDLTANCELGTANYQWDELMQYDDTPGLQGLCPPGWHVPTEAEWNTLFANWTNNAFAGAPLKYSGYSGFNALVSGVRHLNVQWDFQNFATFFWSSTPYGAYKAWAHGMNDYDPSVSLYPSSRVNAFFSSVPEG